VYNGVMTPHRFVRILVAAAALVVLAASGPAVEPTHGGRLIRVPEDVATPREAIAAAAPGDVILLAAGTYDGGLVVPEDKHDLTIRGVDRNAVVFDGKGFNLNAIEVEADRVTLENLSAHDFDGNGFYWERVDGFTGRYLTVWNVNLYGIYATESVNGLFERSLVSGAADAAFYVGECQPCDTKVTNVEGRLSAIGYSGTNTGAGLELSDSVWDRNGTGILPNSFDGQALQPPERQSTFRGNTVRDSGTVAVPAHTPLAGFVGIGIGVAGGIDNAIADNTITGSARYGIALFPTLQQGGGVYEATGNEVTGNTISGSGVADVGVAMVDGKPPANCFSGNTYGTILPANPTKADPCGDAQVTAGDATVNADLAIAVPDALDRLAALGPRPDYRTMPKPDDQPGTPDALPAGLRPFRDPSPSPALVAAAVALAIVAGLVVAVGLARRRR